MYLSESSITQNTILKRLMKTLHFKLLKKNTCNAVILTKLLSSATRLATPRTTMSSACRSSQETVTASDKNMFLSAGFYSSVGSSVPN